MTTHSPTLASRLAGYLNTLVPGTGATDRTWSQQQLIQGLYNAVVGGAAVSLGTIKIPAMLAAIRNALSSDPDVSNLTTAEDLLWAQVLALLDAGGGTPSPGTTGTPIGLLLLLTKAS